MDRDELNAALMVVLEHACNRAHQLSPVMLKEDVPTLKRTESGLSVATEPQVNWRRLSAEVARSSKLWDELDRLADNLKSDDDVEHTIGYAADNHGSSRALWADILDPILHRFRSERGDWSWDSDTALSVIEAWRKSHNPSGYRRQALAPVHNCKSITEYLEIEPGLTIRQFTDEDRVELWRAFGAEHFPGPINPAIADLEAWETVIDYRWELPPEPPLSNEPAVEVIRDTVRALRLHHSGIAGTTIIWHRPDPSEAFPPSSFGDSLFAPLGTGPGLFMGGLASQMGPNCAEPLRVLLQALRTAETDKRLGLAIRRLDSAYVRLNPEDRLIDLWIAFEALLLPDGTNELSYRAAVRIAQLVGRTATEKRAAFDLARHSYRRRSKVVHGESSGDDLGKVTEQTRQLARKAIRAWLLDAERNLASLDHAIFDRDSGLPAD